MKPKLHSINTSKRIATFEDGYGLFNVEYSFLGDDGDCYIVESERGLEVDEVLLAKQVDDHVKGKKPEKYSAYKINVSDLQEIDVYEIHNRYKIEDHSGCKHHASKKILLSGVRTGGKDEYKDIEEARDTLTRWLEINRQL